MRSAPFLFCLLAACAAPARISYYHLLTAADADAVVARDGSGDFRTIGTAVARVPPGGLILVRPGRYREAVVLRSRIRLAGSGPDVTVIDAGGAPAALTLDDSGSVVSSLALTGGRESGVSVAAGCHRIERCLIAGNDANGVTFSGLPGTAAELDHCTIADNPAAGIAVLSGNCRLVVLNSIIAFNSRAVAADLPAGTAQMTLERTCLHNLDATADRALIGKSGIAADPAFLNRPHDYRISSDSPCSGKASHRRDLGCYP